jgi:hypothetical protein
VLVAEVETGRFRRQSGFMIIKYEKRGLHNSKSYKKITVKERGLYMYIYSIYLSIYRKRIV